MSREARITLVAVATSIVLAGCESFKPIALWNPNFQPTGAEPYKQTVAARDIVRARIDAYVAKDEASIDLGYQLDTAAVGLSLLTVGFAAFDGNINFVKGAALSTGAVAALRTQTDWRKRRQIYKAGSDALNCIYFRSYVLSTASANESAGKYSIAAGNLRDLIARNRSAAASLLDGATADARQAYQDEVQLAEALLDSYNKELFAINRAPFVILDTAKVVDNVVVSKEIEALPNIDSLVSAITGITYPTAETVAPEAASPPPPDAPNTSAVSIRLPATLEELTRAFGTARRAIRDEYQLTNPTFEQQLKEVGECAKLVN